MKREVNGYCCLEEPFLCRRKKNLQVCWILFKMGEESINRWMMRLNGKLNSQGSIL